MHFKLHIKYTIKLNALDIIYYVSERMKLLLSYVLLYTIFLLQ